MIDSGFLLLLIHAAVTWLMTGVILVVQLVHYPLFAYADRDRFSTMIVAHGKRMGWIAVPAMVAEGLTAAWLVALPPAQVAPPLLWIAFALLVVIWLTTAALIVPVHRRLLLFGFDEHFHRRLVSLNTIRTVAWSLRALLLLVIVLRVLQP
jgi:hypothetical protein